MPSPPGKQFLPPDLGIAFNQAVANLKDWDRGGDEPTITYCLEIYSIGAIADHVAAHAGDAPENIYVAVSNLAADFRGGPEALPSSGDSCDGPKDHTYASVASCLRGLYDAKVDYYRRKASG